MLLSKAYLLSAAAVLLSLFTSAQTLSIQAGVNSSKIDVFQRIPTQPRTAACFSLNYETPRKGKFSVSAGIGYSLRGYQFDTAITDDQGLVISNERLKFRLNYLHVPLLAHLSLGKNGWFSIGAGINTGVLLSAHANVPTFNSSTGQLTRAENDVKNYYTPMEIGAILQLRVQHEFENNWCGQLLFSYHHGLNTIYENQSSLSGVSKFRMPSIQLGFGRKIG